MEKTNKDASKKGDPRETVTQYMSIEEAGGGDFHPDGQSMVFASDKPGVLQVYALDFDSPGSEPQQLTKGPDRCTNPVCLKDGSIIYSSDKGGNENFQLFVLKDGSSFQLTQDEKAKHRFAFGTDGAIYFSANIDDKKRFDVYECKLPLTQGSKPKLLVKGFDYSALNPHLASKDERKLILTRTVSNLAEPLFIFDRQTGTLESLTETSLHEQEARFFPKAFVDEQTLLVAADYKREFLSLALFDLESRQLQWLEEDRWDTEEVILHSTSSLVYFSKNIAGSSKLFHARLEKHILAGVEELPLPDKEGRLISADLRKYLRSFVLDQDGKRLLFSYSSPRRTPNVWLLELESLSLSQKTFAGSSRFKEDDFVSAELRKFKSFDGLEIPYYIYKPKAAAKEPRATVFIIHGGPASQVTPAFSKAIQTFVSQGYNVVTPNIRGSSGYGKGYLTLDDREKRLDSIADIKNLAEHLAQADPQVDRDRLIVYGASYGGFAVLSSITEYPELFAGAIDIVGISSFVTFLENTAEWRRKHREAEYGSLENRELLARISPISKVDRVVTPTLIVQGDNDERVPLSESIQIYERLHARGIPTKLIRFADEGHGVVKRKNQIVQFSETLKFLAAQVK